jgi:hypothetical protein
MGKLAKPKYKNVIFQNLDEMLYENRPLPLTLIISYLFIKSIIFFILTHRLINIPNISLNTLIFFHILHLKF